MRLLDLFCGAGGAAMGYHRAGFDEVVGVDIVPQPNFPFEFVQADAFSFLSEADLSRFDAIHASPPCQAFSTLRGRHGRPYVDRHVSLIVPVRQALRETGLPYVIENVPRAPLLHPITLCGSMFDLPIRRHRQFEASFPLTAPDCNHARYRQLWPHGFPRDVSRPRIAEGASPIASVVTIAGHGGGPGKVLDTWRWAMGVDWMGLKREVAEAIPPAYTELIGNQALHALQLA